MNCKEILAVLLWYRKKVSDLLMFNEVDVVISSEYSFIIIVDKPDTYIKFKFKELGSESIQLPWSSEILEQIDAADNIASLVMNCTTGDDYRPGNFSKVILSNTSIELQQVNYMNARSLDHKDDYSLRSLVFRIPLNGGKMITEFTDRSSENNRHCGERIKAAIDWLPH